MEEVLQLKQVLLNEKVYCQSIKYYDSSHCIIQKKYYYSNRYYYSNKYYDNKKSIIKSEKSFCSFWRAIVICSCRYSQFYCETAIT